MPRLRKLEFYMDALKSQKCHCGESKIRGMSFCKSCYGVLPKKFQTALYHKIGYGYEEAHDDALAYFEAEKGDTVDQMHQVKTDSLLGKLGK